MKKLNYIKLFEAFDSKILSKTLSYISDKEIFLDLIKKVLEPLDYPISKLNDDFFEYLSFNKALIKADIMTDEPCEATSLSEFPDHAVEGESCKGGLLKRKWGRTIRSVVCPVCNGTGVKKKYGGNIKMLKFWFNKEGNFITTTGVDGIIRSSGETPLVDELDKYDIVKELTRSDVLGLEHGSHALINIGDRDIISYIFRDYSGVFALQHHCNGADPSGSDWRKIAPYSWQLGGGDHGGGKLLIYSASDTVLDINPYSWNFCVEINNRGGIISYIKRNVESTIKDAHFAIVLDLSKLKKSEYVKNSKIKQDRLELRSGTTALISNDEIKKQNISRYLDKLSTSIDIIDDISNLPKLVKKLTGHRYILFLIVSNYNTTESLSRIIELYYNVLSSVDKEKSIEKLNNYVSARIKEGIKQRSDCSNNILELNKMIEDSNFDKEKELLKYLEDLTEILYKRVSVMEIESIEDLEVLYQKLLSVKNLFGTTRYRLYKCTQFIDKLLISENKNRCFNHLTENWNIQDNIDYILSEKERVKKIISKI